MPLSPSETAEWTPLVDEGLAWVDRDVAGCTDMWIICRDDSVLERCVRAIEARDRRMRTKAAQVQQALTFVQVLSRARSSGGATLWVRAVWFDGDYFAGRSKLFPSVHDGLFDQIGVVPDDIIVRHWTAEG